MGLFDSIKNLFKSETCKQESIAPVAIDPTQLEEQKKQADLEKLLSFEKKISKVDARQEVERPEPSPSNLSTQAALKIKNPFRGY